MEARERSGPLKSGGATGRRERERERERRGINPAILARADNRSVVPDILSVSTAIAQLPGTRPFRSGLLLLLTLGLFMSAILTAR